MDTTVVCPNCKKPLLLSDVLKHQMEDELNKAKEEQAETLRCEMDKQAKIKLKEAVETATLKTKQSAELETERLRQEALSSKENENKLRKQLTELIEELSKANKARENAELSARKELFEKEKGIREEATQRAAEDFNTKIREQDETINRLREQLTTAKQVAEQGSQQLQGEILELDVENMLRSSFPFDTIEEVKKGERGSDIRQTVNEQAHTNCGLILWECKNAKNYQTSWLKKIKDEIANEKASAGVIVFNPADSSKHPDDMKQLSDNVWLVKPRYLVIVATLLREAIVKVFTANRNAEGKDIKVEMIYNYLTSGEFNNRIRYILDSYDEMAKQLDADKKNTHKRWAAQEKIMESVIKSLYGMSGDLQGIAGKEIIAIGNLTDDDE